MLIWILSLAFCQWRNTFRCFIPKYFLLKWTYSNRLVTKITFTSQDTFSNSLVKAIILTWYKYFPKQFLFLLLPCCYSFLYCTSLITKCLRLIKVCLPSIQKSNFQTISKDYATLCFIKFLIFIHYETF